MVDKKTSWIEYINEHVYNTPLKEFCKNNINTLHNDNDNENIVLWHVIFIILVPLILLYKYDIKIFRYYLPIIDLIAAGVVYIGDKHIKTNKNNLTINYFNGLYKIIPDNIVSYISTNIINLLALTGVAIHSILWSTSQGIIKGVGVAVVMYVVTYLLPSQLLPTLLDYVIDKTDNVLLNTKLKIHLKKNNKVLIETIISFIVIFILILIETFLIEHLILD